MTPAGIHGWRVKLHHLGRDYEDVFCTRRPYVALTLLCDRIGTTPVDVRGAFSVESALEVQLELVPDPSEVDYTAPALFGEAHHAG